MRARLLLSLAVVAVLTAAALALSRPANASDFPDVSQTFTTRLEPGDNLVGWTGGHKLIEHIWEEVPQIEAVWSWDPNSKRYRIAAPSMPSQLWTLRILEPGMGLMVRIGGDEAIDWERPRKPAQGTVLLIEGNNLVTWLGRDDTRIDHVVKGLGMTFGSIAIQSSDRVTSTPTTPQRSTRPTPFQPSRSETPSGSPPPWTPSGSSRLGSSRSSTLWRVRPSTSKTPFNPIWSQLSSTSMRSGVSKLTSLMFTFLQHAWQ